MSLSQERERGREEENISLTHELIEFFSFFFFFQLGFPPLPAQPPTPEELQQQSGDGEEEEKGGEEEKAGGGHNKTLRDLHNLLVETQMMEGKLVCANCGHEYAVREGIANFLLPSHLV
ncbi:hypothetical protein F4775DRAFT_546224 [Biscogniauxia sp. FL1348]|nr:hypothetical protein F4775DRAFT_546224 [Biscogniauxia sp. FL1348]